MSSKRPRKRLDRKDKYVGLQHWFLTCAAWKSLSAVAKVAYIEAFELRYNGCNNGEIKLSEREVADILGCARETASKAIAVLVERGFLRPSVKGKFHVKTRYATRWILTRYGCRGCKATMDFAQWKPGAEKKQRDQNLGQTGLKTSSDGPEPSLSGLETTPDSAISGPPTGPDSSPVLVYQGERSVRAPTGTQRAKAAWLRAHLEAGVLTPDAIASVLDIRPDEVGEIAGGRVGLGSRSWQKLAALVAGRMN